MFWDQYRKSRCCVGTIIKNVHECPAWRSMLSQRKQYSCIYFTQVLQTCTFPQVENTGSFFCHSDGFVRSPAGAPHYYHSTAASRRREEETSNGNAATSPTEGTNANVVSNGAQSTDSAVEFCFVLMGHNLVHFHLNPLFLATYFLSSSWSCYCSPSILFVLIPALTSPWTRFSSVVAQPLWPITVPSPWP